jgi:PAS domain S-box-containing protein
MEKKKASAHSSGSGHSAKNTGQKRKTSSVNAAVEGPGKAQTSAAGASAMRGRRVDQPAMPVHNGQKIRPEETSMVQTERFYQDIFNSISDAVFIVDTDNGQVVEVNVAMLSMYGYASRDEVLFRTVGEFAVGDVQETLDLLDSFSREASAADPLLYEWMAKKKNGESFRVEVIPKIIQLGGRLRLLARVRNIEGRKQMENEIKIHRDRLLRAERVSRSGNWEFHLADGSYNVSEGAQNIYGLAETAGSIAQAQTVPLPEYRAMLDEALAALVEGRSDYNVQFKIRHLLTGEIHDLHSIAQYDKENNIVFGIIQDITESKRAEQALRESEEQYRVLFETIEHGILYQLADGKITSANPAAERILGVSLDQLRGRTSMDPRWHAIHEDGSLFPGDTHPSMEALRTGKKVMGKVMGLFHPKDNKHHWLLVNAYPLFRPGESEPYQAVASFTDITAIRAVTESLKQRENLLNKILDILPVGLWLADKNGQLVRSNKQGRTIWGAEPPVGPEQFSIFKARRLPAREELKPEDWALVQAIQKKATIVDELLEIHAFDGKKKIIHSQAAPVLNERGELEAAIAVHMDITQRMQTEIALRESEEKFRTMAEQMSDVLFVTDHSGTITYLSPAAEEMFGYSSNEMVGNHFALYLSSVDVQRAMSAFAQSINGDRAPHRYELIMLRKDQTTFVGELQSVKFTSKAGTGTIGVIRNITERKRLMADLVAAKERAEESDRLKTAFLQNISHEIRTPMNGILGFSDMLTDLELTAEKRKYFIEIIRNSGEHLLSIIDDIINVAVLEAGKINLVESEVNLHDMLRIIYDQFSLKAAEKQLQFEKRIAVTTEEAQVYADETKLKQIISNLLVNAFKFTSHGRVSLSCRRDGGVLEFLVSDTGVGIDPQFHTTIFERFRQLGQPASVQTGGIGLGLAICKGYVEQMGGRIWLESTPGQGSDFYFTLPFKPARAAAEVGAANFASAPDDSSQPITVLVAEDDPVNFQLIEMWVSGLRLNLIHAADGREAVELCRLHTDIRLVIMDMRMPVLDGYEATRHIREFNPTLPIIALTAYALSGDREKAMQVGCNDYLARPAKKMDLLALIQKHLKAQ